MNSSFLNKFKITNDDSNPHADFPAEVGDNSFKRIISAFGGKTFNGGLYRVIQTQNLETSKKVLEGIFPEYIGVIQPFAYDWLGRHFAVDLSSNESNPSILLLEVGAGDALIIPADIESFHDTILPKQTNSALASKFWKEWSSINKSDLPYTDCVGYKTPLFLGGDDDLPNLEISNLDVYLEVCSQMRGKVRGLPAGTKIGSISVR